MKRIVNRQYDLDEETDWKLNVQPKLSKQTESLEVRNTEGDTVGWEIKFRYE